MCDGCGKLFHHALIKKHKREYHQFKLYVCNICPDKKFRTRHIFNKHKVTHSTTKPFVCTVCGFR